jgi:hypothetical protein
LRISKLAPASSNGFMSKVRSPRLAMKLEPASTITQLLCGGLFGLWVRAIQLVHLCRPPLDVSFRIFILTQLIAIGGIADTYHRWIIHGAYRDGPG